MLSFFLAISLAIINVVSYRREYDNTKRNLDIIDNRGIGFQGDKPPEFDPGDNGFGDNTEMSGDIPDDVPEMDFEDFENKIKENEEDIDCFTIVTVIRKHGTECQADIGCCCCQGKTDGRR